VSLSRVPSQWCGSRGARGVLVLIGGEISPGVWRNEREALDGCPADHYVWWWCMHTHGRQARRHSCISLPMLVSILRASSSEVEPRARMPRQISIICSHCPCHVKETTTPNLEMVSTKKGEQSDSVTAQVQGRMWLEGSSSGTNLKLAPRRSAPCGLGRPPASRTPTPEYRISSPTHDREPHDGGVYGVAGLHCCCCCCCSHLHLHVPQLIPPP